MTNNKKTEQPKSEAVERPWASNDKLTYDNTLTHCKAIMAQSERIISNAISFDNQLHQEYLMNIQQHRENNRKTLSFLYDIEIPEAIGLATLVKAVKQILIDEGMITKEKQKPCLSLKLLVLKV
jgi:hypothetical protein